MMSKTCSSSHFLGIRLLLLNLHKSKQWKSRNLSLCHTESRIAPMASGMSATRTRSLLPPRQTALVATFAVWLLPDFPTSPWGIAQIRGPSHQIASTVTLDIMPPTHLSDKCTATRIVLFTVLLLAPNKNRREISRLVKNTTVFTMTWWGRPSRSLTCKFMSTKGTLGIKDFPLTSKNISTRST